MSSKHSGILAGVVVLLGAVSGSAGEEQAQPAAQAQQQVSTLLTMNGRVAATQEDALLLRSAAGESMRLVINDDTQVFINGQRGEITDIIQGTEVRASYRPLGEQAPLALRVEVMGHGKQPPRPAR